MSLPLRECGLKLVSKLLKFTMNLVTPLAGVWIEITATGSARFPALVTSLAGVWIEMDGAI